MKLQYKRLQQFAAVTLAFILLAGCSSKEEKGKDKTDEQPTVKVQQVYEREVEQIFTYTAETQADKINNISSSMPLRIKGILVDEGDHVAKGQSVVVLDDVNATTYKLQVDNAQAALGNAKAQYSNVKLDYDRTLHLFEIGGGTRQQVDQMHTQLIAAQNAVTTASNQLASARRALTNARENSVLTSPVSGVVTVRNYDPGDMTSALPVLTVAQVNPIKIIINVSETEYPLIHLGMSASIKLDTYPEEQFTGTISKILPTVDTATRTFAVEITLPNADSRLLPGMFARVELNLGQKRHVVVPDLAVVKQQGSGGQYVYILNENGTVFYSKVQLGQRIGSSYELLEGVPSGAKVVVSGQNALYDGAKVKVAK